MGLFLSQPPHEYVKKSVQGSALGSIELTSSTECCPVAALCEYAIGVERVSTRTVIANAVRNMESPSAKHRSDLRLLIVDFGFSKGAILTFDSQI
jgi:hypothetical protein